MSWSSLRSLCLAVVAPLICFIVSSVYVFRWSQQIDEATVSIAGNGGPSVVYLSRAREDIRRIEHRVISAQPTSLEADRAAVAARKADFDEAVVEYRKTPDYPGELAAWEVMRDWTEPFFAAVDGVLARVVEGGAARAQASQHLEAASAELVSAVVTLLNLNAHAVEQGAATVVSLRRRTLWLANGRDALAFLFVVAGTLLSWRGTRHSAELAAERQRRDADRLAEMEMFAGRVAHELRDPLAAIVMRSSRASRAETLDDARETITRIGSQAMRMSGTIDSLLAFARAAAEPAPGCRAAVSVVVREICAELQPLAAEVDAVLLVEPIPAVTVACDRGVLAIILSNLVRNAIKYMGDGERALRRVVLRGLVDGRHLRMEVADTGPGVPPGAAARIFDPFVRLNAANAKVGIGLGLATVKRFVEANGGEVGVEPRSGPGACFWFTLPLASPETEKVRR